MRKSSLSLVLFIFLALSSIALRSQTTDYQFNTGKKEGLFVDNSTRSGLTLRNTINSIKIEQMTFDDISGDVISLNGIFLSNDAGKPNLPSISRHIAIPKGSDVSIKVKNVKSKTINNIDILPAPQPQLDTDNSPAIHLRDSSVYMKNQLFPLNPYIISDKMFIRDVEVVMVSITPFQYNPVSKDLIVNYDVELEITFEGGKDIVSEVKYRNPAWDKIINDMVLNNNILEEIDYHSFIKDAIERDSEGCEYLIICPDNDQMLQLADSLKLFRNQQGVLTKVITVSECGGNDYNTIKNYIRDAYYNWAIPPAAVLLMGDHNSDETQGIVSHTMYNHIEPSYNPYISDNAYGDVNGDDLPDVVIARITGRDYDEMYHMINKNLSYERQPPTNYGFYNKPITAMGFQLERWFQLCSEVVGGFWRTLGKNPVRQNAIYDGEPGYIWSTYEMTGTVLNYFGPNNLNYIPQNMSHLTEWDANANSVNEAINNGAFIIQHRDHGAEELWGEPSYSINSIKKLSNKDLTFVMSNNCLTGKFNYGGPDGCFAEVFHRHQYGALGLIAATEVSYSFVNDVYVWGVYDNMWPEFMPDFGTEHPTNFMLPSYGNASGKYFLRQSSWPGSDYTKEITYYLFHHHGDAYMNIYSEIPKMITVEAVPVIPENSSEFSIKTDEGATICLSVNGEIIGVAIASGEVDVIDLTPQPAGTEILMTITKQNHYRYTDKIAVVNSTQPYIIFNNCLINDDNNQLDYSETANISITLHNAGYDNISNINATLSSNSPYVEIIDDNAFYENFETNGMTCVDNGFVVKVSDSIPDQTMIRFSLNMDNGDNQYVDNFYLIGNAPNFAITNSFITDTDNNIIQEINKGETAIFNFNIKNIGHSLSENVEVDFNIKAPFITIEETPIIIDALNANDSIDVVFTAIVDTIDCPDGAILEKSLKVNTGYYSFLEESNVSLGNIKEDFESGVLNPSLQWSNTGSKPWVFDDEDPYEGSYCFKSTSNSHSSFSRLIMGAETEVNDKLSFYYKTTDDSGEFTVDIDGVDKINLSSEEWAYAEFDIKAGFHMITWMYRNDDEIGHAFLDLIKLPSASIIILQEIIGDEFVVVDTTHSSDYSVEYFDNAEYYWSLTPEDAGTIIGEGNEISIEWNTDSIYHDITLSAYAYDGKLSNTVRKHIQMSTVSINEIDVPELVIYPNPAKDYIHIKLPNQAENISIEIYDNLGERVYVNNHHPIDNEIHINVDKLGSGTYVVKINSETINTAKLFIINK